MELRSRRRAGPRALAPAAVSALLAAVALLTASPVAAAELAKPPRLDRPPAGFRLSAKEAIRIADRTERVVRERRQAPLAPTAWIAAPGRWQVSYHGGGKERVQVLIDDRLGAVTEAWTGHQVAWRMARGYEGAFGRKLNAPWVWLPLCIAFLLPFVDPRRPFRLIHLDLLMLLAFGVSHIFFNRGEIGLSVPLVYPVLLYLLARMLVVGFKPSRPRGPLIPFFHAQWLVIGLMFLVAFRVSLNITDSNVIDVGYAGVIGADRIADGTELYDGRFPEENAHGDTYGPVNYVAYVPFEQAFRWSGSWDDLPAAHAAAVTFDLLVLAGLLVLGRRLRPGAEGRKLGLALGWAWASYPYAIFVLASNSNDLLVALLLVWALVGLSSAPARGALTALAGAAKLAPLALGPLFVAGRRHSRRDALLAAAVFVLVLVASFAPFVPDAGLDQLYDRTLGFQAGRESPFSVWGQEPSLEWLHTAVKVMAVGLALLVAFVPRRRDTAQVAALGAAVLIAVQLPANHWFYFYVSWFAPLAFVALFARHRAGDAPPADAEPQLRAESRLVGA